MRALLLKLADAELVDRKTRNPERFGLLELEDIGAKDAKSRLLALADDKGAAARRADRRQAQRRAVRAPARAAPTSAGPASKDTWLVNAEIDVNPAVNQWVDTTIFEAQIAQVKRVEVTMPGETPSSSSSARRASPPTRTPTSSPGMPEGKKLKSDYTLEDLVNAFARVELEDVRKPVAPAADAPAPRTSPSTRWRTAARSPCGFAARAMRAGRSSRPPARATPRPPPTRSTRAPPAGSSACPAGSTTSIDKINGVASGWEFRLPAWKYDQIFKKGSDLVDDVKS